MLLVVVKIIEILSLHFIGLTTNVNSVGVCGHKKTLNNGSTGRICVHSKNANTTTKQHTRGV